MGSKASGFEPLAEASHQPLGRIAGRIEEGVGQGERHGRRSGPVDEAGVQLAGVRVGMKAEWIEGNALRCRPDGVADGETDETTKSPIEDGRNEGWRRRQVAGR